MTDIVEKLHCVANKHSETTDVAVVMGQAADEIERLRAALEDAVETLEAMNLHGDNPLYNRLRTELENKS